MAKLVQVRRAGDEVLFTLGEHQVRLKVLSVGALNVRMMFEADREVTFTSLEAPRPESREDRLKKHLEREAKTKARLAKDPRTPKERARDRRKNKRAWRHAWKCGLTLKAFRRLVASGAPLPSFKLKAKKAIVRHRLVSESGHAETDSGVVKSKRVLERERIQAVKVFTRPAPKAQPVQAKSTPPPPEPVKTVRTLRPHPGQQGPVAPPVAVSPLRPALGALPTLAARPEPAEPVKPQPDTQRVTSPGGVVVRRRK
jgi:hypothetical protein